MRKGSKFGMLLALVLLAVVVLTWNEFKFVMGCIINEDTGYINEGVTDIIDREIKPGVALSSVRSVFELDIPGGTFNKKICDDSKPTDTSLCGLNTYIGSYPFGVHDCICGRPIRNFTFEFNHSGKLVSLNYVDRKSCL